MKKAIEIGAISIVVLGILFTGFFVLFGVNASAAPKIDVAYESYKLEDINAEINIPKNWDVVGKLTKEQTKQELVTKYTERIPNLQEALDAGNLQLLAYAPELEYSIEVSTYDTENAENYSQINVKVLEILAKERAAQNYGENSKFKIETHVYNSKNVFTRTSVKTDAEINIYQIEYFSVINGKSIAVYFFSDISDEGMKIINDMSEQIMKEFHMYETPVKGTGEKLEKESNENRDFGYIFPLFSNIFIFAIIIGIAVSKAYKRSKQRQYTPTYGSGASQDVYGDMNYEKKSTKKDVSMSYDHCENDGVAGYEKKTAKRDMDMGYDHCDSSRDYDKPMAKSIERLEQDQRFSYAIKYDQDYKDRKNEQNKSLYESGMIEKEEYDERTRQLRQLK